MQKNWNYSFLLGTTNTPKKSWGKCSRKEKFEKLTSAWKLTFKISSHFQQRYSFITSALCEAKNFVPISPENFFFDFKYPNTSMYSKARWKHEHLLKKETFLSDYSIYVLQETFIILLPYMHGELLCLCFTKILSESNFFFLLSQGFRNLVGQGTKWSDNRFHFNFEANQNKFDGVKNSMPLKTLQTTQTRNSWYSLV